MLYHFLLNYLVKVALLRTQFDTLPQLHPRLQECGSFRPHILLKLSELVQLWIDVRFERFVLIYFVRLHS